MQIAVTGEGIEVGAAATLTRLMHFLKQQIAARPAHETETFRAVVNQLRQVLKRVLKLLLASCLEMNRSPLHSNCSGGLPATRSVTCRGWAATSSLALQSLTSTPYGWRRGPGMWNLVCYANNLSAHHRIVIDGNNNHLIAAWLPPGSRRSASRAGSAVSWPPNSSSATGSQSVLIDDPPLPFLPGVKLRVIL